MNQTNLPSAPVAESLGVNLPPPSYDEAMGNTASTPGDQNIPNNVQTSETLQDENELKKREQKKEAPPLATAPPPLITTQPLPVPVPETTYAFQEPVTQQPRNDDCLVCIYCLNPDDVADCCYCIFCCSRHVTGHDAGCCHCGDECCGCPEGCCECGDCDCDCGDCDCNCDDCDCDCGDCDCSGCDCGDCTIM